MTVKIIAGGGIVENEDGEILFQYRRGKWDLPKGKLDEGETIEECAVREVEEETGLQNIQLGKLIGITHHHYNENGKEVEKETHWFAMKVSGEQKLTPQLEEDILELRWVAPGEVEEYFKNTFHNIVEIVTRYYEGKTSSIKDQKL
jgi:8-oxo-dGTP pyrophosphatase MutT (NUDIX family)